MRGCVGTIEAGVELGDRVLQAVNEEGSVFEMAGRFYAK